MVAAPENIKRQVYLCTRCGYCRDMVRARDDTERLCPIRETTSGFELYIARGRNWIARQILEGKLSVKDLTERFIDAIYACLLCGNCTEHCLVLKPDSWERFPNNLYEDHLIDNCNITRFLRSLIVEEGRPPTEIQEVLQNYQNYSNPYGEPKERRDAWTKELDFKIKNAVEEKCEVLLYVGSIASYHERNQKGVQALAKILHLANVDFGILGAQEEDSGGEVRDLGEEGLFEEFANRNLELFRKHNISNVVCVSPHDYNAFVNYYPEVLGEEWTKLNIKIQHYTELLANLISSGKLTIKRKLNKKVTYHDPCDLGRKNNIFEAPRKIIEATGAKLVEMKLSRRNSYCCGGGALWYRPLDKPQVEVERIKQAMETQADTVVTACPVCTQMLEDGVKAVGNKIKVMEIPEILLEALI